MSAVEQFETILKELPTLKAPGVSGSRIKKLTDIAVKNVSDESKLITILYSNCKAAPSSHKLGTLYVVDSIVRVYIDEAKKQNQPIEPLAPEGTFADGVNKISELIESLIDDAMELLVSKSQKVKIGKLIDIWERAETFSPELIRRMRDKHFQSHTPPGSPPASHTSVDNGNNNAATLGKEQETSVPNNDSGSILLALASLAKQSNSNSSTPNSAPATLTQVTSAPPDNDNSNHSNNILSQLSAMANHSNSVLNPVKSPPQANPNTQAPNQNYILNMLLQMQNSNTNVNHSNHQAQVDYGTGRRGRDDNGAGYSRRNRSRSPNRFDSGLGRRERSPRQQYTQALPQLPQQIPMQQQQQNFNPHQRNVNYSPQITPTEMNVPGSQHYRPRNVGFDSSIPQGSFKVLSRTLFIGGVPRNMTEGELSNILRPFAEVQSVILNSERKHAFVKVYSRREAEQVITSFNKDNSLPLRTRWGVGFGPRDCCNYQHGVSIIPIQRLTDADKLWVVQAQWGGTGGQPLQSGLVIDEPDIEIGAGISSKAMSKKMPTNSARNGPKSNKPGEPDEDYVKTTLIPQNPLLAQMSQNGMPNFNQPAQNPLSGLFANNPNTGFLPVPGQVQMNGPTNGFPANDFMNTLAQGGGNPNLNAQLANFFQNQGMNQQR